MYTYFVRTALAVTVVMVLTALLQKRLPAGLQRLASGSNARLSGMSGRLRTAAYKYSRLLLGLLFLLFLFTRLYKLGLVPLEVNQDELGIAYDARCLLQYQVDRYQHPFPVYLTNFGSGQNALYAYLTMAVLSFADFSIAAIRLPAVLSAIPCFFCSYFIAKEILHDRLAALLAPVFVTILPFYFMSERWSLESYLLLSYLTIGFCFYILALEKNKKLYYFLAGLFMGVTLYAYAISYLVIPLFLLLSVLYCGRVKRFDLKKLILLAVPLGILAFPLILFQLVNMDLFPEIYTRYFSICKLLRYRGGEFSLSNIPKNWKYLVQLVTYDRLLLYNATYEYGSVYTFSIPLLLYGLFLSAKRLLLSVKSRQYDIIAQVTLLFLSCLFVMAITKDPYIHRANGIFLPLMLMLVIAVVDICKRVRLYAPVLAAFYITAFLSFASFYYNDYNTVYSDMINFHDVSFGEMIEYLNENYETNGRNVYIYEKDVGYPEL